MRSQLRGSLWLLVFTLVLCSGLYPMVLWAIGRLPPLQDHAQGSLIAASDGTIIGSRLIAQPFTADEFFQPRPSAAGYNALASGASNWSPSNYRLRDRVARALGPIVKYGKGAEKIGKKPGDGIQGEVEAWFSNDKYQNRPGIVAQWAALHAGLAEDWLKSVGETVAEQWNKVTPSDAFLLEWEADFGDLFTAWATSDDTTKWRRENPGEASPPLSTLVQPFFESFAKKYPGRWPILEDFETAAKKPRKRLVPSQRGADIQMVFFDMWRQEHPDVPLELVPADMVMASGSGLDPHITLDNARHQLKYRVAEARTRQLIAARSEPILKAAAKELSERERTQTLQATRRALEAKIQGDLQEAVHAELDRLLQSKQEWAFHGLVGVPLVNVLEVNIAVGETMTAFSKRFFE